MANNMEERPDVSVNQGSENSRAGSIINLLAGIWLIVSPFVFRYAAGTAVARNNVLLGVIVAILAIIGLALNNEVWSRWLNFIAGIWLIVSAFIAGYAITPGMAINNIIVGALIIGFSAWSANAVLVRHRHGHAV